MREIVFVERPGGAEGDGHWYANFGYFAQTFDRKTYREGACLRVLDVKTGQVRDLVDDPRGTIRDPCVHYDAEKVLFSYRPGGQHNFHLYEVGMDGSGLKHLTDGIYDDIEPTYLPDGGIAFVSGRAKRWVNCWLTQVAVLNRCDGDGTNLRPISANIEQDNTPWVLPDGRILYTRWEYVDRSQVDYHHLWTVNPDGSNHAVYYGNLHPGCVFIDAKPIPGSNEVVLINSPGHGNWEHMGPVAVVTPDRGPDDLGAMRNLTANNDYRDPWAFSRHTFLAAQKKDIVLLDDSGGRTVIYSGRTTVHEPRPVIRREREHVIPTRVDASKATGTLLLTDVRLGRNMGDVKPGEIKKLLVLETLPKPINYTGGMDPLSYSGTFTLERIIGTVPVEEDGSAYFELPANRAFFFVALDENNLSVKRMQSFTSVAPGETTSCIGCHELRTQAPSPARRIAAMRRALSVVTPVPNVPDIIDFPRDVQPILDRHCVRCHDYEKPAGGNPPSEGPAAGGVILTGDRGPMFSHSYFELTIRRQFVDGRNLAKSNLPPRTIGTSASPLMRKLDGNHHGVRMSPGEIDVIRCWIESGAAYPGTYAALGSGMIGGYAQNGQVETDRPWPEAKAAGEAIRSRCATCHGAASDKRVPMNLSDEMGISFWRMDMVDPLLPHSRHRVWNLSRPEKSRMLLAPLAKSAGGFGTCTPPGGEPVFADTHDPDYRAILSLCVAGRQRLEEITRFDMADFKPPRPYLREMHRYGTLPDSFNPATDRVDVYALDRRYFESLWYYPPGTERPKLFENANPYEGDKHLAVPARALWP
ncbi:MAG: hypothetical protein NTX40_01680 [Planctomycetota bacterium]|nr:hypothetical protein [Planctomycetota bacterium]